MYVTASMASGIRTNFGTMTKPLHVGKAASNGVTAAMLAKNGFEANMEALDGPWGFFSVFGKGFDVENIEGTGHTDGEVDFLTGETKFEFSGTIIVPKEKGKK